MRCPRCFRKLAPGASCPTDGAAAAGEAPALAIDPGAAPAVPGWRLDGLLGAGGQAAVWRARRERDDQLAAIKIAHVAGPEPAARFAEEAAVLAAIGAPAVAAIFEHGALADRRAFVAMELLDGATLGDRLAATAGTLALEEVLAWLRGIAAALATIHAAGFVHRDLKPENVVRDRGGAVRLLDLGLAQRVRAPTGATVGQVVGTPLYMAPEQLRGGAVDARADLYALGALGFEAATARPPFIGDRAAIELGHLSFRPPRASALRPVPAALDELLIALLAKEPAARPADARAVEHALAAIDPAALVTTAATAAVASRSSVALVAVERAPATHNLAVEAGRRGGQVARQTAGRAILAFAPDDCPAPLPAALATAHALHAVGARVAIHVAQVTARRGKDGRTMLFGAAVDKPVEWIPSTAAAGVLLTDAAARELTGAELEPIEGGGVRWRERGDQPDVPEPARGPLLGCDALLASARASARAVLDDGRPATWVALGGAGSGKSRIADELAAIAGASSEVAVVRLSGQRSFGAGAAAATRGLFEGLAAFAPAPESATPQPLTAQVRAAIEAVLAERALAIVIDDAQWIDDALLEALGVAARSASGPLWLAATGSDTLAAARPTWLDGSRVSVEQVPALDDADARVLVRRALAPARRVPEALLARLAARCGGVPGVAAALARELRRAGAIRRHPGSDVWFVAADELDFLPPTPGVQWFAARQLAGLGPGVAELARAGAVLGPRFTLAEIDAATRVAEAGVAIDPRVGTAALIGSGLVVDDGGALRFRSEAEQDAIADAVPAPVRRAIHAAVLAHLVAGDADGPERWARVAFHAARAGEPDRAIAMYERLAAEARARHAPLEAVRWLTLALEHAGERPTALRGRLLGERGAARRLLTHYEAAKQDLRAARAIAEAEGDQVAAIELLVADGACCDFTERLAESARLIEEAEARAAAIELPAATRAHLDNWLGVVRARQERLDEARALLAAAIARADQIGDHGTAIGSMLMLGGVLRRVGRVEDGLAILDRAIALCDAVGDHFHLAVGLFNRINIWRRLDRTDAAEADAERAIEIANRSGLDQVELWGWYNLSELRWWTGDLERAFAAAESTHRIGSERFRESPPVVGSLWFAMLLAAAGDVAGATRVLDEIRAEDLASNPGLVLTRDAVRLACAGEVGAAWDPVIAEAARAGAEAEDAVFVWWLRARTARRVGAPDHAAACARIAEEAAAALGKRAPPIEWPGEV